MLSPDDLTRLRAYARARAVSPERVASAVLSYLVARWRRQADRDVNATLASLATTTRDSPNVITCELTPTGIVLLDPDGATPEARSDEFHDALQVVLRFGLDAPDRPLAEARLLAGRALENVIALGRGDMPTPVTSPTVLHAMAARRLATPDAPAMVYAGRVLTYAQLFDRVESAARELSASVAPGDLVLVVAAQSDHAIVGILAAAALGAAYVPVDLDWPPFRLRQVLRQVEPVAAWVPPRGAPPHLSCELRSAGIPEVSCSTSEQWTGKRLPDENARAYVLFTSGSTGEPKGVQATHAALSFMCTQANVEYGLHARDRVLQFSSLVFDVSVWEIFGTLSGGACLVIPERDDRLDPGLLTDLVTRESVSVLAMTPSVLALLDPNAMPTVRAVSIGGELVRTSVLGAWWQSRRACWNAYGPSETVVYAVLHRLRPDEDDEPPLGRPLPGLDLFVVDEAFQPVPVGAVGELCIAGPTVGAGYLNDVDRTKGAYVPVLGDPARTMYRSGDLVRWRRNGLLQYVRREDTQVKVNGYRIELQEIEVALRRLDAVSSAAVLVTRSSDGVAAICAFAATHRPPSDVIAELRTQLPRHAVPSRVVVMPDLPLNASGKVDREALRRALLAGGWT